MFEDNFKSAFMPFFNNFSQSLPIHKVTFDKEESHAVVEHVLPGFEKANFSVSVEDGRKLTVEYKRDEDSENKWDFDFKKVYKADFEIDTDTVKAGFVNGILTVEFYGKDENDDTVLQIDVN